MKSLRTIAYGDEWANPPEPASIELLLTLFRSCGSGEVLLLLSGEFESLDTQDQWVDRWYKLVEDWQRSPLVAWNTGVEVCEFFRFFERSELPSRVPEFTLGNDKLVENVANDGVGAFVVDDAEKRLPEILKAISDLGTDFFSHEFVEAVLPSCLSVSHFRYEGRYFDTFFESTTDTADLATLDFPTLRETTLRHDATVKGLLEQIWGTSGAMEPG